MKTGRQSNGALIAILICATLLLPITQNLLSSAIDVPREHTKWLLAACVVLAGVVVAWSVAERTRVGAAPTTQQISRNRRQLLAVLQREFAQRLEDDEFHRDHPLVVTLRWVRTPHKASSPHEVPTESSLLSAFDKSTGQVVLSGDVGSGKSTCLLGLATSLVSRALEDPEAAVPLVLPLAAWRPRAESLDDWICRFLQSVYSVRPNVARALVDSQSIVPLLDGLDEVRAENIAAAVREMNAYIANQPIAVTARPAALQHASEIKIESHIALQPLDITAIVSETASEDAGFRWLAGAARADADLSLVVNSPLMLRLASAVGAPNPRPDQPDRSTVQRKEELLSTYVSEMLRRRVPPIGPRAETLLRGLTWLATNELRQGIGFTVADLRPAMLPSHLQLTALLLGALTCALISSVTIHLALFLPNSNVPFQTSWSAVWFTGLFGLAAWVLGRGHGGRIAWAWRDVLTRLGLRYLGTLTAALCFVLVWAIVKLTDRGGTGSTEAWVAESACLAGIVLVAVAVVHVTRGWVAGLAIGTASTVGYLGLRYWRAGHVRPLLEIESVWVICTVLSIAAIALLGAWSPPVRPAEALRVRPLRRMALGLLGLLLATSQREDENVVLAILYLWHVVEMVFAVMVGLRSIESAPRGEGLARARRGSAGAALLTLAVLLPPYAAAVALMWWRDGDLSLKVALTAGSIGGAIYLLIAPLVVLLRGGAFLVQHVCTRGALLAIVPGAFRLRSYLEECRRLGMLRRVGPRYEFIHRVLAEWFARRNPTTPF